MARRTKVLAVASGGGHWQQLLLLRASFNDCATRYATTDPGMASRAGITGALVLRDCSRETPIRVAICVLQCLVALIRLRPDVVVSTGALPGAIALVLGKLLGARTIWIDSIANAEEMSGSGRAARRFSDLWLSQWEDVAARSGAQYRGAVP